MKQLRLPQLELWIPKRMTDKEQANLYEAETNREARLRQERLAKGRQTCCGAPKKKNAPKEDNHVLGCRYHPDTKELREKSKQVEFDLDGLL